MSLCCIPVPSSLFNLVLIYFSIAENLSKLGIQWINCPISLKEYTTSIYTSSDKATIAVHATKALILCNALHLGRFSMYGVTGLGRNDPAALLTVILSLLV